MQEMPRQGPRRQTGLKVASGKGTKCVGSACNCERRFVSAEPVRRGYEITSYQCPRCMTILKLAQKTSQRRQYDDE
jgi:hypothetical protein